MEQAAAEKTKEREEITLNTIILAGLERGLSMQDIRRMQLGHMVDFVIEYNQRQKKAEQRSDSSRKVKHYRLATKDEVDLMLRS